MVALSTCDTGKWSTLEKWLNFASQKARDQHKSLYNYEAFEAIGQRDTDELQGVRRLRQSQKRLTAEETARMCQKYLNGATAYELGVEFGIDRRTVSVRLKKAGILMRQRNAKSWCTSSPARRTLEFA